MANLAGQRTFKNIQDEIGYNLFADVAPSANTHPTLTHIKLVINKHYKEFYNRFRNLLNTKETTIATTGGQQYITMPDLVMEVLQMTIRANGCKLRYVPRKQFLDENPAGWTNVGQAQPTIYIPKEPASNNALQFDLYPTPDAVYSISYLYQSRCAELSADADVPLIQPEFDPYLVHASLAELLFMLGDERYKMHKMEAEAIYQRAWVKNEQTPDYIDSVKDYGTMAGGGYGWPGQVRPYL
jgi:hypothetical protein